MSNPKPVQVFLLSPKFWKPLQVKAFAKLPESMHRYAQSVLELAHSRHVGLPADLVVLLVPLLLSPRHRPAADNPWLACFERLRREVQVHRNGRLAQNSGLVMHANPSWTVLRLVLPLVNRACRELGLCFLFCEDVLPLPRQASLFQDYVYDLSRVLAELPGREDADCLFWRERALSLAALSQKGAAPDSGSFREADGSALAMLLRVSPEIEKEAAQQRNLRLVTSNQQQRRSWRSHEGGVDGIHLTRRPEDLDGILLSEFTNPDFLLTDRLLNTGFYALERCSPRQQLRDVYLAALMPGTIATSLLGDFVKACWFECMARLGHRLRRAGLLGSAFAWSEGDRHDHLHSACFLLDKMPSFASIPDGPPGPHWRHEFLTALGWLPRFLCPDASSSELGPSFRNKQVPKGANPFDWVAAVWKQLCAPRQSETPNPSSYSFVYLMIFLPSAGTEVAGPSSVNGVHSLVKLPGQHVSITEVPAGFQLPADWYFTAGKQRRCPLLDAKNPPQSERVLAASLISTWLEQISKEIWRV